MKNENNNENKNNETEKKETLFQKINRKGKEWYGRHMWVKDVLIFGGGTVAGFMGHSFVLVAKEIIKEASSFDPNSSKIEVPGGTITFEEK